MTIDLNVEQAKNEAAQLRQIIKRIEDTCIFNEEAPKDKIWLELNKEEAALTMAALMLACNSCEEFIQAANAARRKAES